MGTTAKSLHSAWHLWRNACELYGTQAQSKYKISPKPWLRGAPTGVESSEGGGRVGGLAGELTPFVNFIFEEKLSDREWVGGGPPESPTAPKWPSPSVAKRCFHSV